MKNRLYIILLLCGLLVVGCTGKQKDAEPVKTYDEVESEFIASLTANDTLAVMQAADSLMTGLKNGELETSLSKLFMVENRTIVPLSPAKIAELCKHFRRFPVVDYKLEHLVFSVAALNDMKYSIQFAKKDNAGKAPTISFVLNPVRMNGTWYLCVKGKEQYSKDMRNPIHPKTPVY